MGKKRKYYFPPKKQETQITVSEEVKAELMKLAEEMVARREAENLNNYIAFTLEALNRLGWTGRTRLNRFLAMLTTVSEEATNADDSTAYADEIKKRLTDKGVTAFIKNDDAAPQPEGANNEKPV